MVDTVQNTIKAPIEIVDQPEEDGENNALSNWLLFPIVLTAAIAIFVAVSRILSKEA